jgi:hypothetical protein
MSMVTVTHSLLSIEKQNMWQKLRNLGLKLYWYHLPHPPPVLGHCSWSFVLETFVSSETLAETEGKDGLGRVKFVLLWFLIFSCHLFSLRDAPHWLGVKGASWGRPFGPDRWDILLFWGHFMILTSQYLCILCWPSCCSYFIQWCPWLLLPLWSTLPSNPLLQGETDWPFDRKASSFRKRMGIRCPQWLCQCIVSLGWVQSSSVLLWICASWASFRQWHLCRQSIQFVAREISKTEYKRRWLCWYLPLPDPSLSSPSC